MSSGKQWMKLALHSAWTWTAPAVFVVAAIATDSAPAGRHPRGRGQRMCTTHDSQAPSVQNDLGGMRVYPKVSGLSHKEINNNKHSLRSNTKGCGGKSHNSGSQNSDTTAPSGRELYHLQFSLQAASPETFGYTVVFGMLSNLQMIQSVC
jgi:hypothetical protein